MHIMYCGAVGAGKTFCAVHDAIKDAGDFIFTNQPIDDEKLASLYGLENVSEVLRYQDKEKIEAGTKIVKIWEDFSSNTVKEARCGTLLIDEAPLWLDARKWDSLSPDARRKIIEHRKDDLFIVSTAQDVSFIDKIFRILCDEVRILRMISLPFVGFLFPYSKRPTIICEHCGRIRRDGVGDDSSFLKKLFGFGTVYLYDVYKPTIILKEGQDATGQDLPEEKAIRHGFILFDIRIAQAYDTSKKLSAVADTALRKRLDEKRSNAFKRKPPKEPLIQTLQKQMFHERKQDDNLGIGTKQKRKDDFCEEATSEDVQCRLT